MKRRIDGFILVGLGICLLMALFLSHFASSSPDGLEKVAETKGFVSKGEEWKFWKHAPLPDYEIPWIKNKNVSTSLSGLVGTLAIFLLVLGIGKLIKKSSAKKVLPLILLICLILFSTTSVFAARPLTTDDTGTVEKGKFQLETGFDFARQDNHDKEFNPSVTLTYGLFERMDMGIGSGYLFLHPAEGKKENGLADTELKVKYRLIDEKDWMPSFAVTSKLKIPTASESKGLGSGKTDFGINLIFTKNLSKRWVFHNLLASLTNQIDVLCHICFITVSHSIKFQHYQ
jgi:cobalt/nickel transport protein